MSADFKHDKLRFLPVQVISVDAGIILKRGCTEVKISGEGASEAIQVILEATGKAEVNQDQLLDLFAPSSHQAINKLIEELLSRRLLIRVDSMQSIPESPESESDIFYWHFNENTRQVAERLNKLQIVILGVNFVSRQIATSLAASGVDGIQIADVPLLRNLRLFDADGQLKNDAWPTAVDLPKLVRDWEGELTARKIDCVVACSDFGQHSVLNKLNRFCIEHRYHFLPAVLHNLTGYVGPFVVPGETACFECLQARQAAHLENRYKSELEEVSFEGQGIVGFLPSMASVIGDLVVVELMKFYSRVLPVWRVGIVLEVNLLATSLISRRVLKLPRCPTCSSLNTRPSTNPKNSALRLDRANP